jgi:MFS family permease
MLSKIAASLDVNRTVLALSVARLGDAMGNSIVYIVIPLYVAALAAPMLPAPEPIRVAILISLYGLVNSAIQPMMGSLSDRLGRRKVLIQIGLLAMGLCTLSFMFADQFSVLLLLRSLQGVGVAITIPASMALIAVATKTQTRGGSMGVYTAMRFVGFALGPILGGYLYDQYGFNAAFIVGAAFIFFGMALVQAWVKDVPTKPNPITRSSPLFDRKLLTGGILAASFATFVMAGAFSMMATLEEQFNARLNETAFMFGIAFGSLSISRLIFQIPLGKLSDRIGRRPLMIAGLVLLAPATALLGFVGTTLQLIALRLLQGIASSAIAAPAYAVAADLSKVGAEGKQMSIATASFGLGIAVGPLIAGVLVLSAFDLPFLVGGALSLLGAWIVYRYVPETIQRGKGAANPASISRW